ncbi:hypothetical protein D3C73_1412070 [compost metagenome]
MAFALVEHLGLLPQAGRCLAEIVRAAEVDGDLFPEILPQLDNVAPVQPKLLRQRPYVFFQKPGYPVYSFLFCLPFGLLIGHEIHPLL